MLYGIPKPQRVNPLYGDLFWKIVKLLWKTEHLRTPQRVSVGNNTGIRKEFGLITIDYRLKTPIIVWYLVMQKQYQSVGIMLKQNK